MSKQKGPSKVTIFDCSGCEYCLEEGIIINAFEHKEHFCTHPTLHQKEYIGRHTVTPEWCPEIKDLDRCEPDT